MGHWTTFGDFANDAFLGLLLFIVLPLAIWATIEWWKGRR